MNFQSSSCKLCSIISNPFNFGEIRPCDVPFHNSSSFATIPALGPLCVGHAMIVSKYHFPSLLHMNIQYRKEFQAVSLALIAAWPTHDLTFAEHGSSSSDGSGPCIAHTHINVIPGVPENMLALEQYGHDVIATGSLDTLPVMTNAYFLIGRTGNWSLYNTGSVPSQYIRQILYAQYNLPHWDWRLFPNENLAALTFKKWNALAFNE